ncbi:hypothetical protein BT69DRAFT_1333485 [Atractiella rhizophila]|nr:hypothetical protein BT69DRAFT_1333485 [Atractiella rhizophila]
MREVGVGARTHEYHGHRGNLVYVNDLNTMIAEFIANPLIRKHLTFLPEDTGNMIQELYQGEKWKNEVNARLLTPSIVVGGQQYFVDEVIQLNGGQYCFVSRWFTKGGTVHCSGYEVHWSKEFAGFIIDQRQGMTVPVSAFERNGPALQANAPSAYVIKAMIDSEGILTHRLEECRPISSLRESCKGHRVVTVPIVLYADDTSGNRSKKWNKHQTFLMTLAGLPNKMQQQEFCIQFLGTTNVGSVLELLEGIVAQILDAWEEPVVAFDSLTGEEIVFRPLPLLFEGDNPMQSEFCSIAGLASLKFCRVCKVGAASKVEEETEEHIHRFMTCGTPRLPFETLASLQKSLATAADPTLPKNQVDQEQTATGVKDTFTAFFIDQLLQLRKDFQGSNQELEVEIRKVLDTWENQRFKHNPAFQLLGLDFDFHHDTPFEILHGILLGFTKYLWRDNMKRLSVVQRAVVIRRLNSLEVSGLQTSRISGSQLVDYAHSLVGKDFKIIMQIVLFALDGILSDSFLLIWVALGRLGSLVWRPKVTDKAKYLYNLEAAIAFFLDSTASLTTQWFNKRKFHLLVHLVDNVRRFGVPINYATEKFESYNGVVRLRSVFSNHQAPGVDIATSFAGYDRVRHIFSGGFWKDKATSQWVCASSKVIALMRDESYRQMLGLTLPDPWSQSAAGKPPGSWELESRSNLHISAADTILHKLRPSLHLSSDGQNFLEYKHLRVRSVTTASDEEARTGTFVLVEEKEQPPYIFQINQILLVQPVDRSLGVNTQELHVYGRQLAFTGTWYKGFQLPLLLPSAHLSKLGSADSLKAVVNVQHACQIAGCIDDGFEMGTLLMIAEWTMGAVLNALGTADEVQHLPQY